MPTHRTIALLVLGLIARECFSFWTGHPFDFELWVRLGYAMNHGADPYGLLASVPGLSFANIFGYESAPTIAYLPFWPLVTGLMFALYSLTGVENRFVYYFLLKQPVILGDVLLAYLLCSYVSERKSAAAGRWVLSFWLFSPFTIIVSGIWGMFESVAICFLMTSVGSKNRWGKSVWTGLAIFAKSIPIIYAAPVTLKRLTTRADVLALILTIGLPSALSAAIFLLMKWPLMMVGETLASTVGKGGSSMSVWDILAYFNYTGGPVLPNETYQLLGFVWIPALALFTLLAIRRFRTEIDNGLFQALIVCTLAFLIFKAQITEQYALYLFALTAVDVAVWHPERKRLLVGSVAVALSYLVINNYFLVRFLAPVYPGFADFENAMFRVIGPLRYVLHLLLGTGFTCLNVAYLVSVFRQQSTSQGSQGLEEQSGLVGGVHERQP